MLKLTVMILDTGAAVTEEEYKAIDPQGKAFIKGADYIPPHEMPDEEYPLWLTTGRLVYHFHTRTKTGRSKAIAECSTGCLCANFGRGRSKIWNS